MADMFKTPLAAWHEAHGAKMAPFAGWWMPIQYEGILAEHRHTRTQASVFDICHMGEFTVKGRGAKDALLKAFSHSLATLKEGRCRYGFILNEEGGVLDDCIVYNMGEDDYFIVVNAACIARDFKTLCERMPAGVACEDISSRMGKIDLQGPKSCEVLEHFLGQNLHDLGYFAFRETEWSGRRLLVSRTGYTGELGYELYIEAGSAQALWEALLKDERVKPAGLGARDTLRMEAGLPLYGDELDEKHTPVEAGMGRMMKNECDYVGKKGLGNVREVLLGLELEGRRAARHGDRLCLESGEEAGVVTSGTFAPSLGKSIAFAWCRKGMEGAGSYVIDNGRAKLRARSVETPFYKDGTARAKLQ